MHDLPNGDAAHLSEVDALLSRFASSDQRIARINAYVSCARVCEQQMGLRDVDRLVAENTHAKLWEDKKTRGFDLSV